MTRLAAACAALALALPSPASAQLYDPAYRWRTLDTAHFRVHFHQGEEALAQEVAAAAERAHAALSPVLGYSPPGGTEIVLSDDTDDANGSATPLPYDIIRVYAVPPDHLSELGAYRDWVSALVFHEYVHILHLDHVGGVPAIANRIFGKLFTPNGLVPGWMTEGLAVSHEADGDPGVRSGRNQSALQEMYARALAVEPPGFPRLDQVSNPLVEWPLGNLPYLLGGRFMAWLERRYGDAAMAGFLADQGSQIWPYAPSWAGERWFHADFPTLWKAFTAEEEARFAAQLAEVRARPVTAYRRLTREGGTVLTPRWTPDGRAIVYRRGSLDARSGLRRVTPDGVDLGLAAPVDANGAFTLASGSEAVVAVADIWREHRFYDDLWRVGLDGARRERLTDGARATDPALDPSSGTLVHVKRTGPGALALVRRTFPGGALGPEELLFSRAGAQVYAPALAPGGRRVAFELHEGGRRDVVVLDGDREVRVTDDAALDLSPSFTPDGRWLLFSSDRSGIFNLYAWPVEACLAPPGAEPAADAGAAAPPGPPREPCALRQITNVETGAFQPALSPDGRTLAFVSYSRAGYDVSTLPFDPATWLDPAPPLEERAAVPPVPAAPTEPLPSRPYSAWSTVGPTWWFPVWGSDVKGPLFGAATGGQDVLARHAWAAQAWWGTRSQELGYSVGYAGGWSWPTLDLSSSRFVDSARGGSRRLETVWTPLDAGATFTWTHVASAVALRAGWRATIYDVLGVGETATRPQQLEATDGFLSELTLGATFSDARRYVRSITAEEGRSLSLFGSLALPALGSDVRLARGEAAVAQYLRVPGTRHVVLAVRAASGLADGSLGHNAPFSLGGVIAPDVVSVVLMRPIVGANELRGYPGSWLEGTGFVLGNAELRFPIAVPERGYSTWPVFLRRVHGAVFADLGDAFDRPGELAFAGHHLRADELRLGAGAELRLELAVSYAAVFDVRLGLAHAFGRVFQGESREPGVSDVTGYVTIGQGF